MKIYYYLCYEDNNIAKVLHVYPEGDLLHYLEKVKKIIYIILC